MKSVSAATFGERLGRFVRWFFTVSPDAAIEVRSPVPRRMRGSAEVVRRDRPLELARRGASSPALMKDKS